MRLTIVLISGVFLGMAMVPDATQVDLGEGRVQLLSGFTEKRTGTKDSYMGQITETDSPFVIHYDLGAMAGLRMHPEKKKTCAWFKEQVIQDQRYYVGLEESGGGKKIIISIVPKDKKDESAFLYPANFWANIKSEEQVVECLLTALSFRPKAGKP